MTRNEKVEIVSSLTEEFKTSDALVVCEYKGLNVPALEELRIAAKEAGVNVRVIKNTLAGIAMKNADIEGIELKDTNIFVWGEDQLNVTKVVSKFAEKSDIFAIKTAFIAGEIATAATVEALSKMPSRDELIGMLLQTWMAPVTNFTIGLDALRAKKEEESA
ncbi:50S ribosomal protein L10 [Sulfurospirillum arcachonense]|uniref:50S ribosomal protein L10 n=1 Tax=Sulfurospirillum arcachonense TaxID=57666 RepID=UPI00046AB23A|nr:50S ribosomal protein L10 [Sulfurospirillum arcachonense]